MEVRRERHRTAPASTYAQSDNVTRAHVAGGHWPARLRFPSRVVVRALVCRALLPTTPSESTRRASPGG